MHNVTAISRHVTDMDISILPKRLDEFFIKLLGPWQAVIAISTDFYRAIVIFEGGAGG